MLYEMSKLTINCAANELYDIRRQLQNLSFSRSVKILFKEKANSSQLATQITRKLRFPSQSTNRQMESLLDDKT